jgi:hypothetical protein
MHLLWARVFIEAYNQFHLVPCYIDMRANHLADDLSRERIVSLLSKVPQASPRPTPVPQVLVDLLLDPRADWGYPQWRDQFRGILNKV